MAASSPRASGDQTTGEALACWACPNPECARFNHFAAGNLRGVEGIGRGRAIRRLYCTTCGHRFSERQGTLLEYSKLPLAVVVRLNDSARVGGDYEMGSVLSKELLDSP